ncbi:hypothetical protein [Legionella fallonii]|uniref:hypothetical protein n=1 Tax=Legionella fallonii TaxID=96230 RepID=UPI0005D3512A|nr:hypothetical protein [Legionella fallonii]
MYLESSFDAGGNLAQSNIMSFRHGVLEAQRTVNGGGVEVSHSSYGYDVVGNLTDVSTYVKDPGKVFGYTSKHHYSLYKAMLETHREAVINAKQDELDKEKKIEGAQKILEEGSDPDFFSKLTGIFIENIRLLRRLSN